MTADFGDQVVNCNPGDKIKMRMRSNPSTGYSWIILQHLRQENKIYEITETGFDQDVHKDDKQKKMVGVGGYESFVIEVDKVGEEHFISYI